MNRRGILLTLSTVIILSLPVAFKSYGSDQSDADGVKAASSAFYEALSVIDTGEALNRVVAHTPYITFTSPFSSSINVGYEAWKQYWSKNNTRFEERKVSLTEQYIHVNGDLAWEMGQEQGTVKFKDGKIAKFAFIVTNVYERIDGRWLLVSHHVQPKPK